MDKVTISCPLPITKQETITLAHGSGGKLMHNLIDDVILSVLKNRYLDGNSDSAVIELGTSKLAFTTDSYVVNPIFFPGGDIGTLAVNGTVNDLAMSGAKPLYLSVGLILEEGFPIESLKRIMGSMNVAAKYSGITLVTGDTKVVDKGKGDGIFINTAGIGVVEHNLNISPYEVKDGDVIILNGELGEHGIAIMAVRENLSFESNIKSDTAPLVEIVNKIIKTNATIHCFRDLTRGGLGSALNEIAEAANVSIEIYEENIPVRKDVQGACEILGLDPIYIANEGKFITIVPEKDAEKTLEVMKKDKEGKNAKVIGKVKKGDSIVSMKTTFGTNRIIDMLTGEQLPRIC
ncbi:MAG: hydrogenase expression/formation protein HypE [Candidatus Melainabacteria bacterium]|nr:hydrogenase expression/formation protein HypE [Candidatus Melainabacteria bacterium]